MISTADKCPKCGAARASDAPEGLCAECLLQLALGGNCPLDLDVDESPEEAPLIRQLGDFELIEQIGRGGMGVVYKARQKSLNRLVALKLISAGELASPDFIERFKMEAEAAASLDHPHIVPIYEVGEVKSQHYLAMKLIEGVPLDRKLASGPLPCRIAAEMAGKLARAVHFAHQRGILHRDLKPNNILVDAQGSPFLTDFGLAKLIEKESTITRTLAVLGTPSYISPEQAAGNSKSITTAADVYGLGAVLYETLTGQPPFAGGTTVQTIRQVLEKEPRRPSLLNRAVDRDLETVCLKCLEKDPARRYASADALAGDLERWLHGEPISARPAGTFERLAKWTARHPTQAALAAVSILALVSIATISSILTVRINRARQLAENRGEESRKSLVRLNVAAGLRREEDKDVFAGLLWHAEALRLENGDAAREAVHRARIESAFRQAPRLLQVWTHHGPVLVARFSLDGRRAATGGLDNMAHLFDAHSGEEIGPPLAHSSGVAGAVFSPDGKRLATWAQAGEARVWNGHTGHAVAGPIPADGAALEFAPEGGLLVAKGGSVFLIDAESGQPLYPPLPHRRQVNRAVLAPDGQHVLVMADELAVRYWEFGDPPKLLETLPHPVTVRNATFSHDGKSVVTVGNDCKVRLWDLRTGTLLATNAQHGSPVYQALFTRDDSRILTASWDGSARLWDTHSGQLVTPPMYHRGGVRSALFSPDEQRIITASWDNTARLWTASDGQQSGVILRHGGFVTTARFSPDGKSVLTTSMDGAARLWRVPTSPTPQIELPHEGTCSFASTSPDRKLIATASHDHTAKIWNAADGRLIFTLQHSRQVAQALFSPDGRFIASAADDGKAHLWNASNGRLVAELACTGHVTHVAFTADSKRLLSASDRGSTQIWTVPEGRRLVEFRHAASVLDVRFSPDDRLVATGSSDHTAAVWDAVTGKRHFLLPHKTEVHALRFSPNGERLLTASSDDTQFGCAAQLWDMKTGQAIGPAMEHKDGVRAVAFSPNGELIATGGEDNAARIWKASTGQPATPWLRHSGLIYYVAFSPDGKRLVTASFDQTAKVWDVESGAPITTLPGGSIVFFAEFLGDGSRVITCTQKNGARIWNLSETTLPVADVERLAELYSAHRLDSTGGLQPLEGGEIRARWQALRPKYPQYFR